MKKQGFTLAEVLITLGIIGVVAALTTPAIVQNAGTAKIGPSLAKAINTWEVANESMLNDNEAASLKAVGIANGGESTYINLLSNYMKISPYTNNSYVPGEYYGGPPSAQYSINYAGGDVGAGDTKYTYTQNLVIYPENALSHKAISKDGFIYCINIANSYIEEGTVTDIITGASNNVNKVLNPTLPNHKLAYGTIIIDINGIAEPNKYGKDVFAFILNADGSLSAWGENNLWNTSNDKCNSTTVGSGMTCGASVLENNRKVIY